MLSEMPDTTAICLVPLLVFCWPTIRGGNSEWSSLGWLSTCSFQRSFMPFTLSVFRIFSSFCQPVRWWLPPSVSQSAAGNEAQPREIASAARCVKLRTVMTESAYRGRSAVVFENEHLRVTVLRDGGHIAEIFDKQTGVNPLWTPPWPSVEPSEYNPTRHPEFGTGTDARLLAGIMGHNLCLDIFGGPSPEEAAAGITAHGEGSVAPYEIDEINGQLNMRARLPLAQLHFERSLELHGRSVKIREAVENLSACDRPIAWTQHVTLGPGFLEPGVTEFRASATLSKVYESQFGNADDLKPGASFEWPMAPRAGEGFADLRTFSGSLASSAFTTHLMDPRRAHAFFAAFAPAHKLAFGYIWKRADFPWM